MKPMISSNHKNIPIPKVLHLYWGGDRPLSFLRHLTVVSFLMFNPDWKIVIWKGARTSVIDDWKTGEHYRYTYKGPDFFDKVSKIFGVEVKEDVEINNLPICEVHKSDLIRWKILSTEGGWWSDFDIVYFSSMKNIQIEKCAEALICPGSDRQNIGFLASVPGSELYERVFSKGMRIVANKKDTEALPYQILGSLLLSSVLKEKNWMMRDVRLIPENSVYPFCFPSMKNRQIGLWKDRNLMDIGDKTIGIHWYGGDKSSCFVEGLLEKAEDVNRLEIEGGSVSWAIKKVL